MLVVRMGIGDFGTAMLTVDEVIDHSRLQGARAKQGYQGNHVLQGVGQQTLDQLLHAA